PHPLLEVDEAEWRRQQTAGPPGEEDQRGPRRVREVQGRFRRGRRFPIRLRLVLAPGEERQARSLQDAERRESAGARRHPDPRLRRLGALLLHRLSQPPARLSEGVPGTPRELGVRRRAVRESLIFALSFRAGAKRQTRNLEIPGSPLRGASE